MLLVKMVSKILAQILINCRYLLAIYIVYMYLTSCETVKVSVHEKSSVMRYNIATVC